MGEKEGARSTNLMDWVNLATNVVVALQAVLFNDARAGLYPQRFYRLTAPRLKWWMPPAPR